MIALTLYEDAGAVVGLAIVALIVWHVFKPIRVDVTVRHVRERFKDDDVEREQPKTPPSDV